MAKWAVGATRFVLLTKRNAFKFPRFDSWKSFLIGLLANMQETSFNTLGCSRLCPIRFSFPGGFLVVMPRCEPLLDEEYEELVGRRGFEKWTTGDLDGDDGIVIPVEQKQSSLGWYKNRIVAVDYGS